MFTVKLSIEDYNKLYIHALYGEFLFCKKEKDEIILLEQDEDINEIAHIKLDTREGEILSHYINCLLRTKKDDGKISLYKVCMGEFYDCAYCEICPNHIYRCSVGMMKQLENLNEKIEDIQFVDPIPNRTYEMVERLEKCSDMIWDMKKYLGDNPDADIQAIYSTIEILERQLKGLLDKWDYQESEEVK